MICRRNRLMDVMAYSNMSETILMKKEGEFNVNPKPFGQKIYGCDDFDPDAHEFTYGIILRCRREIC